MMQWRTSGHRRLRESHGGRRTAKLVRRRRQGRNGRRGSSKTFLDSMSPNLSHPSRYPPMTRPSVQKSLTIKNPQRLGDRPLHRQKRTKQAATMAMLPVTLPQKSCSQRPNLQLSRTSLRRYGVCGQERSLRLCPRRGSAPLTTMIRRVKKIHHINIMLATRRNRLTKTSLYRKMM